MDRIFGENKNKNCDRFGEIDAYRRPDVVVAGLRSERNWRIKISSKIKLR